MTNPGIAPRVARAQSLARRPSGRGRGRAVGSARKQPPSRSARKDGASRSPPPIREEHKSERLSR